MSQSQQEILLCAAHFIMQGYSWQEAREKTTREFSLKNRFPDSSDLERCLRNELYFLEPDHAAILKSWRELALIQMQRINTPLYLTGAVLNGCATVHSDLRLAAFSDNPKDIEVALMQAGIDYEVVDEQTHKPQPSIAYGWLVPVPRGGLFRQKNPYLQAVAVCLEVFSLKDQGRLKGSLGEDPHQNDWERRAYLSQSNLIALLKEIQ